jgi:hypothetical protein
METSSMTTKPIEEREAGCFASERPTQVSPAFAEMVEALKVAEDTIKGHFQDDCGDCCAALAVISAALSRSPQSAPVRKVGEEEIARVIAKWRFETIAAFDEMTTTPSKVTEPDRSLARAVLRLLAEREG